MRGGARYPTEAPCLTLPYFPQMFDLLLAVIVLVNVPKKWALFDATASVSIFIFSLVKFGLRCFLVAISLDMLNVGLAKVGQLMNTCTRCRLRGDDSCRRAVKNSVEFTANVLHHAYCACSYIVSSTRNYLRYESFTILSRYSFIVS